jgi:hypothetical protein
MISVLSGNDCIGQVLARYYRTGWHRGQLSTGINCRGCPYCRAHCSAGKTPAGLYRTGVDPRPAVHTWGNRPADPLATIRGNSSWLSIWWRDERDRTWLAPQLLERLARRGLGVLGGPGVSDKLAQQVQEGAWPHPIILDRDQDLLATYRGPLVWMMDAPSPIDGVLAQRLASDDITYLVHPTQLASPDHHTARLIEVSRATVSINKALGAL